MIFLSVAMLRGYDKTFNDDRMLEQKYDFCYMCFEPETFLRVEGKDSKEMRMRAEKEFACKVFAPTTYCNVLSNKDKTTKIMGILK
jgi:hypothetical protein